MPENLKTILQVIADTAVALSSVAASVFGIATAYGVWKDARDKRKRARRHRAGKGA